MKLAQLFRKPVRINPVVLKEMRARMRGGRTHIIITIYLLFLAGLIGIVYLAYSTNENASVTASDIQILGKSIFGSVVALEMVMVAFLSPALTAGAISAERERQTYDLLRTTLLPARSLVNGKLFSAMSFIIILLFVGFPLQSLALWLGGVSVAEVLISFLLLVITALTFSVLGLFVSSFMKNTLASTVISYILSILSIFGLPFLFIITLIFIGIVSSSNVYGLSQFQQNVLELVLYIVGYILVCLNPLAAAIASEVMLVSEQSVWFATIPLSNGWKFPVIGPWIIFTVAFLLINLVFIMLSIRFVRRVER